ncbi:response regulator [Brevibacillus ginsengisoli]|uniref:response regulator n=1 Tax=Brevibacillus ginsengisoli TaxID=363854 RepID=UPI003CF98902
MFKLRILHIEDQPGHKKYIGDLLSGLGVFYGTAKNLTETRQQLKTDQYNSMLIDYNLGEEINGIELYHTVAAEGYDYPALIVTGYEYLIEDTEIDGEKLVGLIRKLGLTQKELKKGLQLLKSTLVKRGLVGIWIPAINETIEYIHVSDVYSIQRIRRQIFIYTHNRVYETSVSLKVYAQFLAENGCNFFQCRSNTIVNLDKYLSYNLVTMELTLQPDGTGKQMVVRVSDDHKKEWMNTYNSLATENPSIQNVPQNST